MPQEGLNTIVGDMILDALYNNVALAFGIATIGLYEGHPGDDGTANVFAGATRESLTCSLASGAATAGTGGLPSFTITAGTTTNKPVAFVATWNGFETDMDAVMIQTGRLLVPQVLAEGDTLDLGSVAIAWESSALAAD